ncbi:hypothetical protein [Xanthomonas phage JGB6]|nr:hypothetical protein [Xanthomonas phage JGB6]
MRIYASFTNGYREIIESSDFNTIANHLVTSWNSQIDDNPEFTLEQIAEYRVANIDEMINRELVDLSFLLPGQVIRADLIVHLD